MVFLKDQSSRASARNWLEHIVKQNFMRLGINNKLLGVNFVEYMMSTRKFSTKPLSLTYLPYALMDFRKNKKRN